MKRKKTFLSILLALCLIGLNPMSLPCFDIAQNVEAASAVKLSKSSAILIKGQTLQLKVTGTKSKVKWYTSKSSIATVSQSGKVVAKNKGTAVITAKIGNKKYTCKITVETPKISKTSLSLTAGSKYTLKVTGTKQKITWTSSNKAVATVSSKGLVITKKAGTVTVTSYVNGKTSSALKCRITVKAKPTNTNSFTKLKNYILKYGSTNQAGHKFLRDQMYDDDGNSWVWCVIVNNSNQIEFMVSREDWNEEQTYGELFLNSNLSAYVKYEYTLYEDDGTVDAIASINPATYTKNTKLNYNIIENNYYYSSTISKLADSFLSVGFAGWMDMLKPTGVTFKNLGFKLL